MQTSHEEPSAGAKEDRRADFLLEMYRQTSIHLGRHVTGVWQCVGVAGGALAVFALDKNGPFNDFACALAVLLSGWLVATTLDASNWFNRNIKIITNLERLHLAPGDDKLVHYFYLRDREPGEPVEHFTIQIYPALSVGLLILAFHFVSRVWTGFHLSPAYFDPPRALPYVAAAVGLGYCAYLRRKFVKADETLQQRSPGHVSQRSQARVPE